MKFPLRFFHTDRKRTLIEDVVFVRFLNYIKHYSHCIFQDNEDDDDDDDSDDDEEMEDDENEAQDKDEDSQEEEKQDMDNDGDDDEYETVSNAIFD